MVIHLEDIIKRNPNATLFDLAKAATLLGLEVHFQMVEREISIRTLVIQAVAAHRARNGKRPVRRWP